MNISSETIYITVSEKCTRIQLRLDFIFTVKLLLLMWRVMFWNMDIKSLIIVKCFFLLILYFNPCVEGDIPYGLCANPACSGKTKSSQCPRFIMACLGLWMIFTAILRLLIFFIILFYAINDRNNILRAVFTCICFYLYCYCS